MTSSPKTVAILAGGKATRFDGQDKGEILVNGQRLIDIISHRLKPHASEFLLSGRHDYGLGFKVVPDVNEAPAGPVGGIYSIWESLRGRDIEGFYTVPVDGPNLPLNLLARLYSADRSRIALDAKGRHPTFAWWRMKDLAPIWATIDRTQSISLNRLADLVGAKEVEWPGHDCFININRQSDLDEIIEGL